jgi:hypothetical protein
MTLPKAISDAITTYRNAVDTIMVGHARAALERAIADHVADAGKMVPAPTEAEIEAWRRDADSVPFSGDGVLRIIGQQCIEQAVALMRRAAAAKNLTESRFYMDGKWATYEVYTTPVLGWNVGEPLPNLSVEVNGVVTRYVPEQAAATPAPSALERLRDRVDEAAANADTDLGEWRAFDRVLDWIDEEREREAGHG